MGCLLLWAAAWALPPALGAPRPSPSASAPYFVKEWVWPAASRGRGPFLLRSDFRINATASCTPREIVCVVTPRNAPARLSGTHWQHAQQVLLPCWSLFRLYPNLTPSVLLDRVPLTTAHPWTRFVLDLIGAERIDALPATACAVVGKLKRKTGTGSAGGEVLWLASPADASELQRRAGLVLVAGPERRRPVVKVLNRKSHRRWDENGTFGAAAAGAAADLDEAFFEALEPRAQAAWIHGADVLISPHGAQLSNLLFARRCTVVLELFPRYFYVPGFYLPLALGVGGVAFAGYGADDPAADAPTNRNQTGRYWFNRKFKYRKTDANPAVVAAALPALLDARRTCLAGASAAHWQRGGPHSPYGGSAHVQGLL